MWTAIAREVPDRPAVICGDRTVTWAEFDERAARLASHLAAAGVQPGDRVALDLTNVPEYLETLFAALKIGAAPLNVNYRYLADEVRYVLTNSGARALVHAPAYASVVAEAIAGLPDGDPRSLLETGAPYEAALAAASPDGPWQARAPTATTCVLLYTGGTTGMPKGVMWRNDDLYVALWQSNRPGTLPKDPVEAARAGKRAGTALPACPLMHGTGLFIALSTLAGGGTVVLDRRDRPRRRPGLVARLRATGCRCSRSWATCSRVRCSPRSTPSPTAGTSPRSGRSRRRASPSPRREDRAHAPPARRHDHRRARLVGRDHDPLRGEGRRRREAGPLRRQRAGLGARRGHRRSGRARQRAGRPRGRHRADPARLLGRRREDRAPRSASTADDAGRSRATTRPSSPTGASPSSAGATPASTPAARRCTRRRSRSCCATIPRSTTAQWWASPTRASARWSSPWSCRSRERHSTRCRSTSSPAAASPDTSDRVDYVVIDDLARSAAGKANLSYLRDLAAEHVERNP